MHACTHPFECIMRLPPKYLCLPPSQEWTNRSLISLVSTVAALLVATSFVWASLASWLNRQALRNMYALAAGSCQPRHPLDHCPSVFRS